MLLNSSEAAPQPCRLLLSVVHIVSPRGATRTHPASTLTESGCLEMPYSASSTSLPPPPLTPQQQAGGSDGIWQLGKRENENIQRKMCVVGKCNDEGESQESERSALGEVISRGS